MSTKINELKTELQKIALKNAKKTLKDSGFKESDKYWNLRQYEMQFCIYEQLKLSHGITNE